MGMGGVDMMCGGVRAGLFVDKRVPRVNRVEWG